MGILEMNEKEINEAVARKLGWEVNHDYSRMATKSDIGKNIIIADAVPKYCHSIAAAWEIVEHVAKKNFTVDLSFEDYLGFKARVSIRSEDGGAWTYHARGIKADTAPMAICLAFLKLP